MAEIVTTSTPIETVAAMVTALLVKGGRLGVAGGSVAKALGTVRATLGSSWQRVKLTWVDERVVPQADKDSNRGEANRTAQLSGSLLELPLVEDGESAAQAVARVSALFARDFDAHLDVALLGMGEDGHVASLFPGHRLLSERVADFAWLDDSPKPPSTRLTMTLGVLADPMLKRIVLATGAGKREALQRIVNGDSRLPIAMLGALTIVTDQKLDSPQGNS